MDGIFKDNEIIFDITETDKKIPLHNLKETLFKRLKLNNASDIQFFNHMLTVEHLRYVGDKTLSLVLQLLKNLLN